MVEVLMIAVAIIVIRAVYLWLVRGSEDAKSFMQQSTNEARKVAGWVALVALIGFALFVLLIAAIAS